MKTNHSQNQCLNAILQSIALLIGAVILFTSCSKRDDNVIGKWRVTEGRNTGAIFEFTPESRLNIYGGQVQASWYGLEIIKKIPIDSSKYLTIPSGVLGMPDEQGDIAWEAKNKIKFFPEKKYSDSEITVCNGSLYILIQSTKERIAIEEMQLTPDKKLEKVGEMILIPYNAESKNK